MSVRGRSLPAAAGLLWCLIVLSASRLPGQTGGWKADERVLITDFGVVTALARSPGTVFGATGGGLVVFDEAFGRWESPVTVEDGYPQVPPGAMAYDRRDGSVWLAAGGQLLQFDPFGRRFRDRFEVQRPVTGIVPDEATGSDLFLRVRGEWWRLDTFSRDLRRADPGTVLASIEARSDLRVREKALRDPFFVRAAEQSTRSSYGGPLRILDLTPSRDANGWWLGTAGGFLFQYDDIGRVSRGVAYGPFGRGMAAVVATESEVWFAPERRLDGRYGVARATRDLERWRVWRADSARTVPDLVSDLERVPGGTWAGGASGLSWLRDGDDEWREERAVDLTYQPVLSLAPASGRTAEAVWVGTARGLLRVTAAGGGVDASVMPSEAVTSVVEAQGYVWAGTEHGLFVLPVPDSIGQPVRAGRAAGPAALRDPVGALTASGDTIYAGLGREVWWRPGTGAPWARLEAAGRAPAVVSALAMREGVLWVGSAAELSVLDVAGGVLGRYSFGPDLPPGPRGETAIRDISVVSHSEAWIAIPAGAIRLEVRH